MGLEDVEKRSAEVYVQGHWEKGGYLRGEWSGSRRGCLLIVSRCPADTFTFAQRGEGFILLLILVQLIGTPALHRIFIFSA